MRCFHISIGYLISNEKKFMFIKPASLMRYMNLKAVIDFMQGFVLRDTLCHVPKLFSYLFT